MTVLKKRIQISFWFFIALAIFLAVFSVQNAGDIQVKVLWWPLSISLSILLIGTFVTGLVIGALYAYNKFLPQAPKKETDDRPNSAAKKDALNEKPASSRSHDASPKDF